MNNKILPKQMVYPIIYLTIKDKKKDKKQKVTYTIYNKQILEKTMFDIKDKIFLIQQYSELEMFKLSLSYQMAPVIGYSGLGYIEIIDSIMDKLEDECEKLLKGEQDFYPILHYFLFTDILIIGKRRS